MCIPIWLASKFEVPNQRGFRLLAGVGLHQITVRSGILMRWSTFWLAYNWGYPLCGSGRV